MRSKKEFKYSNMDNKTSGNTSIEKQEYKGIDLSVYSTHMRGYVESFKDTVSFSDQIANLELTSEEEELFKKFKDPITSKYIDIPVILNEKRFDFESASKLTQDKPKEIIADLWLENQMNKRIQQVINNREEPIQNQQPSLKRRMSNFFSQKPSEDNAKLEDKKTDTYKSL